MKQSPARSTAFSVSGAPPFGISVAGWETFALSRLPKRRIDRSHKEKMKSAPRGFPPRGASHTSGKTKKAQKEKTEKQRKRIRQDAGSEIGLHAFSSRYSLPQTAKTVMNMIFMSLRKLNFSMSRRL